MIEMMAVYASLVQKESSQSIAPEKHKAHTKEMSECQESDVRGCSARPPSPLKGGTTGLTQYSIGVIVTLVTNKSGPKFEYSDESVSKPIQASHPRKSPV
jgi:hypothetical protein